MSRKEIEESKHKMVPAKKPVPKKGKTTYLDNINISKQEEIGQPVDFHFKESGKPTDDTNGSFAMRRDHQGGRQEYFIKFATAGAGSGRLLNPWGLYFSPGDDVKFEKQLGRKTYEFKKVSKSTFELYMKFLSTRNERYLLNAEREALDATGY